MEAFLIYQIKVAVLATVFVVLYRFLLGKQTFHRFNRLMLLTITILAVTLPAIRIESLKVIGSGEVTISVQTANSNPWDDGNVNVQDALAMEASAQDTGLTTRDLLEKAICYSLLAAYCIGLIFFIIRYVNSMKSVARLIEEGRYADRREGCDVIESNAVSQPMNWMQYIVMPKQWLESKNESMAWKHEHLHASRFHSLDLLLADMLWAMQWFNPAMKMLHSEIELIHEFEADRAVLDSGTDARQYKLMLVSAVAQSKGIHLGNWLRQTKLKNRIDMMDKEESNGWNKLRALFIPIIALLFLYLNSQTITAQDRNFKWPDFEDGKVWVFKDGTAKVLTFDGVQSSMNAGQVASYLKNYKDFKTTRMTLMYMYPIEGLADAQSLAEQLLEIGVHVNVANNTEMLARMNMPEFRQARIYGPAEDGKYRFEMNCNLHEKRVGRASDRPYDNLSAYGSVNDMVKWINMFDGYGIAVYPSEGMSCQDLQELANATWHRGIQQVSVVETDKIRITFIPVGTNLVKDFGKNTTVITAADKINLSYYGSLKKPETVNNPLYTHSINNDFFHVARVVRTKDMTVLVFKSLQGPDLWLRGISGLTIKCLGEEYRQTASDGLSGFEEKYFWSPDWGYYTLTAYFPGLPEDAWIVDVCDDDGSYIIKNMQVTNALPDNFYDRFITLKLNSVYELKTLPKDVPDGGGDNITVYQIDFTNTETTVYCKMFLAQPHSFPGFVGNDFKMTLADGTEYSPLYFEGVPVNEVFDRHGDFVQTNFQIVFPVMDVEQFKQPGNGITLTGTICHEPVELNMGLLVSPTTVFRQVDSIEPGNYSAVIVSLNGKGSPSLPANNTEDIYSCRVDDDGKIIIKGSPNECIPDGTYTFRKSSDQTYEGSLTIGRMSVDVDGYKIYENDRLTQIYFAKMLDQDHMDWILILYPITH